MKIIDSGMCGLLLIEPCQYVDERGFFLECFQTERYREAGISETFIQDNLSRSYRGVLRGMHYQVERPQAQIVTVVRGRIFDAVVDLRRESETFGRWFGAEISGETGDGLPRQIYMAPGFAHGFCVLTPVADLHYKVSRHYDHGDEGGVLWCDPDIDISWPLDEPIVSSRDSAYPRLREIPADRLPHDPPAEYWHVPER